MTLATLVLFSTKSGASRECAELLATKITDCRVCDVAKQTFEFEGYDTLIIGSGVRMGKFYKPMFKFIEKDIDVLLKKDIAFFLCNSYSDTLQKTIERNIPLRLVENAVCIQSFGGKPPFRNSKNQDWILMDNVTVFLQSLKERE